MQEWELQWNSSANERYGDVMLPKARAVVEASGLEVTDEFGGSVLLEDPDDPDAADNGFRVTSDDASAVEALRTALEAAVGHSVACAEVGLL